MKVTSKRLGLKDTNEGYIAMYSEDILIDENGNETVKIHPYPDSGLTDEDVKRIQELRANKKKIRMQWCNKCNKEINLFDGEKIVYEGGETGYKCKCGKVSIDPSTIYESMLDYKARNIEGLI